jgi:outer membrane protein OmpA-like peptidoglycan-associated protein
MRSALTLIPMLLVLSSCGSPPKPPTVDESLKRPANSAMAIELQVCKSELQNTRITATESGRLAETATATLARASARQQAIAAIAAAPQANSVFTIRFDFGSSRVVVPAETTAALVESARTAPLVMLRGRTDGTTESPAESRIARERAAAVRDYLVGAGLDPARIHATYQPIGDFAADNSKPSGRDMNRRVEIEVYRALPVAMNGAVAALP